MLRRLLITMFLMAPIFGHAATESHRAAAEEVLLLTNADKLIGDLFKQVEQMQRQQIQRMGIPAEIMPLTEKYFKKIHSIMAGEMAWDKIKEDFVDVYTQVFTEQELKELTGFYQSQIGQTFVQKTPELTRLTMQISQSRMAGIAPQLQQISMDMVQDLTEAAKARQGTTSE